MCVPPGVLRFPAKQHEDHFAKRGRTGERKLTGDQIDKENGERSTLNPAMPLFYRYLMLNAVR